MAIESTEGYQLLNRLLNAFGEDAATVLDLFHADAVVEYPYADSINKISAMNMRAYRAYLEQVLPGMPNLKFTSLRVYPIAGTEGFWAEVHGETTHPVTRRLYEQDYVIYFEMKAGKFMKYKEYWNVLPVLKSMLSKDEIMTLLNE